MIHECFHRHVSKVVSPLAMPAKNDVLVGKHVERGAILYLILDETLWIDRDGAELLYESISYMKSLGASQSQCYLVLVLTESSRGREYEQLRYWQRSGGCAIGIEEHNLEKFFKNEDKYIEGRL